MLYLLNFYNGKCFYVSFILIIIVRVFYFSIFFYFDKINLGLVWVDRLEVNLRGVMI